jgi:hypothetical protein
MRRAESRARSGNDGSPSRWITYPVGLPRATSTCMTSEPVSLPLRQFLRAQNRPCFEGGESGCPSAGSSP